MAKLSASTQKKITNVLPDKKACPALSLLHYYLFSKWKNISQKMIINNKRKIYKKEFRMLNQRGYLVFQ
ncbi:MAG: hypothetical protein WAZ30_11955, partial [Syntrophorhabdus sp.]